MVNADEKMGNADEKMGNADEKMGNADEKMGNADEKMGNADEKVGNADEKMGNADRKIGNANEKSESTYDEYKVILEAQKVSPIFIENISKIYSYFGPLTVFSQKDIMDYLDCSKGKATNIMSVLRETKIVEEVKGFGRGKYKFIDV